MGQPSQAVLAVAKLVEQLPLGLVLPGRRLEHGGEAAIDVSATPDGAYVIHGPWAGLCVRAEVVYRLSRWVKDPAERLQYPISNRAPELQSARRAAWAATSEPKEHQ